MKPNARSVLTALRKCEAESADYIGICNGHGPLLFNNVDTLVGGYKKWSEDALEKAQATTAVFYTSDYGFSDRLSQSVARGLTKAEVEVVMMDMKTTDTQELIEAVGRANGIVLLAPPTSGTCRGFPKSKQRLMPRMECSYASLTTTISAPPSSRLPVHCTKIGQHKTQD